MNILSYVFKKKPKFVVELHQGSDKDWDSIVDSFPHSSVYHTAEFGHVYEEKDKSVRILRCMVYDSVKKYLLAVCLIVYFPVSGSAMWFYGPLFQSNQNIEYNKSEVIVRIINYLGEQGVFLIEPAYLPCAFSLSNKDHNYLQQNDCVLHEHGTFVIKIAGNTLDVVKGNFDHSVQKNINKCERMGVVVKRLENFHEVEKDYIPLLRETRERMGFSMPPFYPEQHSWKWLHRKGSIFEVFLAYLDDIPLAGLGILGSENGRINEIAVAYSNLYYEKRIPAHELIKWEILKWGSMNHVHEYDLTGVDPRATDEKSLGIYRFKKKFGGEYYSSWWLSRKI